jgi:ElaB/YqjD/DUF883 family membrane-anchored ribosome-binding protein
MNDHDQHTGAGSSSASSDNTRPPSTPGSEPSRTRDELKDQARHSAEDVKSAAQQQAESLFDSQKVTAAEQTHKISQVLNKMGDEFDQQQQSTFSRWTKQLASQTDRFSNQLRDQDLSHLLHNAGAYSRREPMLFMGGAIAAGFLVSRFLRSSRRHDTSVTTSSPSALAAYQGASPDGQSTVTGGVIHEGSHTRQKP